MRFLVVSAPRSGTAYAAQLFTALGLPCQHETVYGLEPEEWDDDYPGESSWLAAPHLKRLPPDVLVLHQWRNAADAAESLVRHEFFEDTDPYHQYALRWATTRPGLPPIEQARRFHGNWHNLIIRNLRTREAFSYNVEDIDRKLLQRISAFIGHKPTRTQLTAALNIPRNINTNQKEPG